jgi:hypothetical protein
MWLLLLACTLPKTGPDCATRLAALDGLVDQATACVPGTPGVCLHSVTDAQTGCLRTTQDEAASAAYTAAVADLKAAGCQLPTINVYRCTKEPTGLCPAEGPGAGHCAFVK